MSHRPTSFPATGAPSFDRIPTSARSLCFWQISRAPLKYMVKLLPRMVKMYGAQAPKKQPACLPVHMKRLTRGCFPLVQITDGNMELLLRIVILMYDRTSNKTNVNDARKALFSNKGKTLDLTPPTLAALYEHTKQAALQAGHYWGQYLAGGQNPITKPRL